MMSVASCQMKILSAAKSFIKHPRALAFLAVFFIPTPATADALDEAVSQDVFLLNLSAALANHDIDVTTNLNARDVVRQRIRNVRLGRFPDLPLDRLADSAEIANWEAAFGESELGGLAVIADAEAIDASAEEYLPRWLESTSDKRLFVTFYKDDLVAAEKLRDVAEAAGFATAFYFGSGNTREVGELYATAAQRLAIDSRDARRYRTEVTELAYLGERVRRRSNSLFSEDGNRGDGSLARREPSVFLKETLGDEFNQSTIREIIVPGGVAFGETASLAFPVAELQFYRGALILIEEGGDAHELPEIDLANLKALFDFVNRSRSIGSDAIVDIDARGRVRISSALRDTEAGYKIMHADTQPFEFVPNLPVTKSVIIDTAVEWQRGEMGKTLQFEVDYEVRFLSADNMRIAQTRAALAYIYDSSSKASEYSDSWGRYAARLDDNLNYSGLAESMREVAAYAGWAALFRRLQEDEVSFLRGRYDFMKIDKLGEKTPMRY